MCRYMSTPSNPCMLINNGALFVLCAEGDHSEVDVPQTAHQPVPGDG